jgi:hypothetical protein
MEKGREGEEMNRRTFLKAFAAASAGAVMVGATPPGLALVRPVEKALVKQAFDPGYLNELNALTQLMWNGLKSRDTANYSKACVLLYEWLSWKEGKCPEPKWRAVALSKVAA